MTTPTPTDETYRQIEDHRAQLLDLAAAVQQHPSDYVRTVLLDAMLGVFERTAALVARPEAISDTSGDAPPAVEARLFVEPSPAELALMPKTGEGYHTTHA